MTADLDMLHDLPTLAEEEDRVFDGSPWQLMRDPIGSLNHRLLTSCVTGMLSIADGYEDEEPMTAFPPKPVGRANRFLAWLRVDR